MIFFAMKPQEGKPKALTFRRFPIFSDHTSSFFIFCSARRLTTAA